MFEIGAPAENIAILMDWLKDGHRPDFLYRGQPNDYPVMVPSFFRPLVVDLSDPSPVAKIDAARLDVLPPQARARLGMLQRLIRMAGVGLGNVIAQQYGVTSEALDVTESIDVASFFATRRYPGYAQVEDGIGVIYRFDSSADRRLTFPFRMSDLDDLFERGKSAVGFFDFFVQHREMDYIFDRDRWFGHEAGEEQLVSTIPFATSWRDLKAAMDASRLEPTRYDGATADRLARAIKALDWQKTRFWSQRGGFIRPGIYWNAMVPKRYSLVETRAELARAHGGGGLNFHLDLPDASGPIQALPLIVPSSAIKQTAVGVENLRCRSDCQAFFFKHGPTRATPLLRRDLWPEPADDPLYGALWHDAILMLIRRHYPNDIPPVDDPEEGLLDRGYRVEGEAATRDARNFDDLYRGQLEDASEAMAAFGPTPGLCAARGEALLELGEIAAALSALADGLRVDRTNLELLTNLARLFRSWRKPAWARAAVVVANGVDPRDPRVIELDACIHLDALDLAQADDAVARGLALATEGSTEWERFVFLRILVADVTGDQAVSEHWREVAAEHHVRIVEMDDAAKALRARLDRRRQLADPHGR